MDSRQHHHQLMNRNHNNNNNNRQRARGPRHHQHANANTTDTNDTNMNDGPISPANTSANEESNNNNNINSRGSTAASSSTNENAENSNDSFDTSLEGASGERDYLLHAMNGARTGTATSTGIETMTGIGMGMGMGESLHQLMSEHSDSDGKEEYEFVTYNGKRKKDGIGKRSRRYKGYHKCEHSHGASSSGGSSGDEGCASASASIRVSLNNDVDVDMDMDLNIDQSLQDLREEIEKIQNEKNDSNSSSLATSGDMQKRFRSDETEPSGGRLSPPLSSSLSLPTNQLRYRASSADTSTRTVVGGILEELLPTTTDNDYNYPPIRARSYTAPAGPSRRRTHRHGNHLLGTSHISETTMADMNENSNENENRNANGIANENGTTSRSISSILSSLDAGMNTLRRWINSRNRSAGHFNPERPMSISRQSHAVIELSLGEEDYFVSHAGNSNYPMGGGSSGGSGSGSGRDVNVNVGIIRSRSYHGSDSTGSSTWEDSGGSGSIHFRSTPSSYHSHGRITYPQTIQEEDEPIRQRAFSEPERGDNRPWRAFSRRRRRRNETDSGSHSYSGQQQYQQQQEHGRLTSRSDASSVISSSVSSPSTRSSSHLESGGNSLPSDLISNSDAGSSTGRPNRLSFRFSSESQGRNHDDDDEHEYDQDYGHEIEMQSSRGVMSTGIDIGIDEESGFDRMQYDDPNREARRAWIVINQRFQLMLMIVGVLFSFLLFSILVSWVVLTSAYVVSIDEECDLPLKLYFWLATIQLILDVFRKDIMKFIFRFESRNDQSEAIPTRVIFYNLAYLTYAMAVLRLGIRIIFLSEGNCRHTATKLFNTTRIFVIISMSTWLLILFGYLLPFFVVAILLTQNGYSPATEGDPNGSNFGVFPGVNNSAPPGCIDRLKVVKLEEFQPQYPRECCICMADFASSDIIVITECEHVFHKRCCQEWLRQARTCPVCRSDIPDSLGQDGGSNMDENGQETESSNHHQQQQQSQGGIFSQGPFRSHNFQQEMLNLVSILQETGRR